MTLGTLKQVKDETTADLTAVEKKEAGSGRRRFVKGVWQSKSKITVGFMAIETEELED